MLGALGVFLGGGLGSLLRWGICYKINSHWGVMLVNIIGAFLIGCVYEYCSHKTNINPEIKLIIMTGLLGGFTTFSTYLLDFSNLVENNKYLEGFLYLGASILIGLAFLVAGMKIVKFFI